MSCKILLVNHSNVANEPSPSVGAYYKLEGDVIRIFFPRKPSQLIRDLMKSKVIRQKTEGQFHQRGFYYTPRKRFWHAPASGVSLAIAMMSTELFNGARTFDQLSTFLPSCWRQDPGWLFRQPDLFLLEEYVYTVSCSPDQSMIARLAIELDQSYDVVFEVSDLSSESHLFTICQRLDITPQLQALLGLNQPLTTDPSPFFYPQEIYFDDTFHVVVSIAESEITPTFKLSYKIDHLYRLLVELPAEGAIEQQDLQTDSGVLQIGEKGYCYTPSLLQIYD